MDQAMNGAASTSASTAAAQVAVPGHPSERWETAFVYAFVTRFTQVRKKIEGLDTPMDFEQALMFSGKDPIMEAILSIFVVNLRPTIRTPQQKIERYVASVVDEYCRSPTERSIWWNEESRRNIDPLAGTNGFFSLSWDTKLTVLRQLVEWQLAHVTHIRDMIDTAWGVKAAKHTKKADKEAFAPPPPEDPRSFESLRMIPIGQDISRKRYWVVDDSPRIYMSSNPWKSLCPFTAIASTQEEYLAVIEDLKRTAPQTIVAEEEAKPSKPRNKFEQGHLDLISRLEVEHFPKVEAEVARIAKARKRMEQKTILQVQSEIRSTRTRRQTRKPDYVYDFDEEEMEDGGDDYKYIDDMDDFIDDGDLEDEAPRSIAQRRSTRATVLNSRKRPADSSLVDGKDHEWRGERRSSRLGNAPSIAFDESDAPPSSKRAKSSLGGSSVPPEETPAPPPPVIVPAGKKKSKFWYYTVEPIDPPPNGRSPAAIPPAQASHKNGHGTNRSNESHGTNGNAAAENANSDVPTTSTAGTESTAVDVEMQDPPSNTSDEVEKATNSY